MSKKQLSLESFFEKGERHNDEIAEDPKTANKRKLHLKENTKSPTSLQQVIHIFHAHLVQYVMTSYPRKPRNLQNHFTT